MVKVHWISRIFIFKVLEPVVCPSSPPNGIVLKVGVMPLSLQMMMVKACRAQICPCCNGMLIALSKQNKQQKKEEEKKSRLCTV